VGDVIVAIAEEDERATGRTAEALTDGQEVGKRLARVMRVGQGVDHGHVRPLRDLFDLRLRERAQHDRGRVAREHAGSVGDRLAATELELVRAQEESLGAEPVGGACERDARARRRLLEETRNGLRA
jgi:hypothetical protein